MNTSINTADTKRDRQQLLDQHRRTLHAGCFVCDPGNPRGLNLRCKPDGEAAVSARFDPEPWMVGFAEQLHGGVLSTLLDGAMTQCLFAEDIRAVTAVLHTRFRQPAPLDQTLEVRAWIVKSDGRRHQVKSQIRIEDNVVAEAEATFLTVKDDK